MTEPKMTQTAANELMGGVLIPQAIPISALRSPDPFKPKKVAIIGTAPSSRMSAPYNDPTWTIWGTSPGNQGALPRVDAWVEMHCNFLWPEYKASYGEAYLRWINDQQFPVLAQDQRLIPRALTYPLAQAVDRFGIRLKDDPPWMPKRCYFFTSTFAWAMAFAIMQGVEAMALYGVDMSSKDEYILQRSGGHHFLHKAIEAGIDIIIPEESDLAQPPPLYGYSDGTSFGRKQAARRTEVRGRIQQLEQQLHQVQNQLTYLRGADEDIDYNQSVFGGVGGWGWAHTNVVGGGASVPAVEPASEPVVMPFTPGSEPVFTPYKFTPITPTVSASGNGMTWWPPTIVTMGQAEQGNGGTVRELQSQAVEPQLAAAAEEKPRTSRKKSRRA